MTDELKCRCGVALDRPATGRPPRYCSTSCRRSAEYDVRRAQSLLLRAEKALQDARLHAELDHGDVWAREAAWWRAEVLRLEDDLEQVLMIQEGD